MDNRTLVTRNLGRVLVKNYQDKRLSTSPKNSAALEIRSADPIRAADKNRTTLQNFIAQA
jgi:hypothetical protein